MDNEVLSQPNAAKPQINKRDRSAAYPAITIEESLRWVGEIYRNFRQSPTKREDINEVIVGIHNRHIAASSYYALLDRDRDSYFVTDLYRTISNPLSEKEKEAALLVAFESPKLNRQLIAKFDGDEIPKELIAHLSRFYSITEDAAPIAADVFIKNAKYCGVLSESNKLNFKLAQARSDFRDAIEGESTAEEIVEGISQAIDSTQLNESEGKDATKPLSLLPEMVNEERVRVRLSGGKFAYIIHPLKLTRVDIEILKKQIEQLELIVLAE